MDLFCRSTLLKNQVSFISRLKDERVSDIAVGKIWIWFYLNLNCAFDTWHSIGLAFLFPLELEYQELARLEDNRVSYHVIVLYTECIHRHMIGFDIKVWLYFLILVIIKWISTNWNLEHIFRQQSTTWQFQCPCNSSAMHNQKKLTNQLK